jgi:hypothetical protein
LLGKYWWGLKLCFKPHFNQNSAQEVMGVQSGKSPNFGNFGTLDLKSEEKWHLGVTPIANHKEYYKGEGGGFPPSLGYGESCESMYA